jgi:hypothetical protein
LTQVLRAAAAVLLMLAVAGCGDGAPTGNLKLLYVSSPHCPVCVVFMREVGQGYARTEEGQRVPLVEVALADTLPEPYAGLPPATRTPTFILVRDREEIGRIEGYSSDELFWMAFARLLADAEVVAAAR